MKILFPLLILSILITSCKKDEKSSEIVLSDTEFVDFGSCFLEYRIDSAEVIISDSLTYVSFEKVLKNNWDLSGTCNNAHLPTVDFNKSLIVGKYTETTCDNVSYSRQVAYDTDKQKYIYRITINHSSNCGGLAESSFNWAIVPKRGNSRQFIFEISD